MAVKPQIIKKISRRAIVALLPAFLLAACSGGSGNLFSASDSTESNILPTSGTNPGLNDGKIRIAMLLPMSAKGKTAKIAKYLKNAGELAVFEADNPNVILTTKDTGGTPEGAQAAITTAIAEGAELIIGPLFATSVRAVAPIANQANVPVIAFSSDESVAGNGVYLLSNLPGHDVASIISFAVSQGKSRFAALVPQDSYGQFANAALQQAISSHGGQLVDVQYFPKTTSGMLQPAKIIANSIKNNGADALLLASSPDLLPQLATQIPYNSINTKQVQILGTSRWDFAAIGQNKPLVGGWFPAPDPHRWRQFNQRYVQTYGSVPNRIASLSYDAVSLAISLSGYPAGQRFNSTQLTRANGFMGVDGLFRFLANGKAERRYAILQVERFGPRLIKPAPTQFGAAHF